MGGKALSLSLSLAMQYAKLLWMSPMNQLNRLIKNLLRKNYRHRFVRALSRLSMPISKRIGFDWRFRR